MRIAFKVSIGNRGSGTPFTAVISSLIYISIFLPVSHHVSGILELRNERAAAAGQLNMRSMERYMSDFLG